MTSSYHMSSKVHNYMYIHTQLVTMFPNVYMYVEYIYTHTMCTWNEVGGSLES